MSEEHVKSSYSICLKTVLKSKCSMSEEHAEQQLQYLPEEHPKEQVQYVFRTH